MRSAPWRAPSAALDPPPVIGIICCVRIDGDHILHSVSEKYIVAAIEAAGGLPMLIPAMGHRVAAAAAVARLDGILVPGSRTHIEPRCYAGPPMGEDAPHDPKRDATSLPLLRAAAADLPVLAICRGLQELNVALGGTLHQELHEMPGRLDHRAPKGPVEVRYAHAAHPVGLAPGGLFAALADGAPSIVVNSLHQQGIDRLAPGLVVEATAPDGQIEGVRLQGTRFVVGVQWHPEFRHHAEPFSVALFAAFGEACCAQASRRRAA